MAYPYEITIKDTDGVPFVSVKGYDAEKTIKTYRKFNINTLINFIRYRFKSSSYDIKGRMQELTEHLGCTPSKFVKLLNGYMYAAFIKPLDSDPVLKDCRLKFGFGMKGKINAGHINKLHANKEILQQCYKDGIINVTPYVFAFSMTPKQLKEVFGKGKWKKLCKNSFSRNKLLIMASRSCSITSSKVSKYDYNSIPSTILKAIPDILSTDPDYGGYATKHFKGKYSNREELRKYFSLFRDTKRMTIQLGQKFYYNWSPTELETKHEEFTEALNERSYSKEVFPLVKILRNKGKGKFETKCKSYSADVIESAFSLRVEGESMHHCVANYFCDCYDANYVVFSIKDSKGKRYSTLGIRIRNGKFIMEQHYKAFNKVVDDPLAKDMAEAIVWELNKEVQLCNC